MTDGQGLGWGSKVEGPLPDRVLYEPHHDISFFYLVWLAERGTRAEEDWADAEYLGKPS